MEWMDLEPYPGPPHTEPTARESFAALGRLLRNAYDPYVHAFEAFAEAFMKPNYPQSFPLPPRELGRPPRNYGPLPKRTFSHRGRKVY